MINLKYYKNLDGLRAFAALAVVVAHYFDLNRLPKFTWLVKIAQLGNSGVSLFFVLSGFVITRILLNTIKQKKYLFNFYGRRMLRIFPLYYLSLVIYNFLPFIIDSSYSIDMNRQWYHYFYLQNFARTFSWDHQGPGHFWSLAVEEHFYLIWPALVLIGFSKNKNRLLFISLFIIIVTLILRYIMLVDGYNINVFTFTRIDQLALGCVLAILEIKGIIAKISTTIFLFVTFIGVLFVAFLTKIDIFYSDLLKYNAFGIMYFGLLGYCINSKPKVFFNKFLNFTPIQFLGKISYGLYIWHVLVILLFEKFIISFGLILDFMFIVTITVILSSLSFYLFESKFLEYKKHFN